MEDITFSLIIVLVIVIIITVYCKKEHQEVINEKIIEEIEIKPIKKSITTDGLSSISLKYKRPKVNKEDSIDPESGTLVPAFSIVERKTTESIVESMFPSLYKKDKKENIEIKDNRMYFLNKEFEGRKANIHNQISNAKVGPSVFRNRVERDGYS
jgi:hypothetical protein